VCLDPPRHSKSSASAGSLLIVRDVMNRRRLLRHLLRGPRHRPQCSRPSSSAWSRRTSSHGAPTRQTPKRYEYFLTEKCPRPLGQSLIACSAGLPPLPPTPDGPPILIVPQVDCGGNGQRSRHLRELRQAARARDAQARPGPFFGSPPENISSARGALSFLPTASRRRRHMRTL